MVPGAVTFAVACSKHWFKFHSLPPSSVFSVLLKSLLSSFPASSSTGSLQHLWDLLCSREHWQKRGKTTGQFCEMWASRIPQLITRESHAGAGLLTCLVVMHPVQDDFWGSVPPCDHVASHLSISLSGQAKIQDLQCQRKNKEKGG